MVSYHTNINRLQNEIAKLQKEDAALTAKEVSLLKKVNSLKDSAARSKSSSIVNSKLREIERTSNSLATITKKRSVISTKIATKTKELNNYQSKQIAEDAKARKKVALEQERILKQHETRAKALSTQLAEVAKSTETTLSADREFDFFISHASEDKEEFVAALASELTSLGTAVFYDDATLRVGDSLRRNIDAGLRNSRYGVVVLSTSFFKKEWPARELDGLTALEEKGAKRILPIWHKVSKDEVMSYSPVLADKVALNTATMSVKEIAKELYAML